MVQNGVVYKELGAWIDRYAQRSYRLMVNGRPCGPSHKSRKACAEFVRDTLNVSEADAAELLDVADRNWQQFPAYVA